MSTFAEINTAVSKRLLDANNTAVSSSDVDNAINASVAYWKFRRFWFNEVSDSTTLTAQDGTIPLPDEFLVPVEDDGAFVIEYSNMRYPLRKLSLNEYNGIWLGNGYGRPQYYARIALSYECYPLPDIAYTINRHYLKQYTALSAPTDTNDFTVYADRLIMLWTTGNLIEELRQDMEMSNYYRQAARDEYNNLQVMTTKSNSTGGLTLSSALF